MIHLIFGVKDLISKKILKSLFGEDYCVFVQNFIQAPTWWSNGARQNLLKICIRKMDLKILKDYLHSQLDLI